MRFLVRLLVFLFVTLSTGSAVYAQTTRAAASVGGEEDLRETVRELALRVSALEAELRKQRTEPAMESASLKPAALVMPAVDVRSSVESVSSSSLAEAAPVAAVGTQGSTQKATAASVLPTFLPGGATLNYMFDGYYEYDFNHPIGRIQYLRAYDVLSNSFSINQADVVFALDPNVAEGRRYGVRLDLQFGQAAG
jgi:hypothetical protein